MHIVTRTFCCWHKCRRGRPNLS